MSIWESIDYLREARVATLLEKQQRYHAAMHQWRKAKSLALKSDNVVWAEVRAQFCEKQYAEEAKCPNN
ncbi:ANR family transcriptional regulator [Vibrio parahaemolyticus]|nr:ANR family transcriptional regulator [Vibrio parahaemolyticus]MCR9653251.1 ANR family transcriptional regulator [Vibrio parahaemolyticus]